MKVLLETMLCIDLLRSINKYTSTCPPPDAIPIQIHILAKPPVCIQSRLLSSVCPQSKPSIERFPYQPNQLCCSHSRAFPSHQIMRATSPHIVLKKKSAQVHASNRGYTQTLAFASSLCASYTQVKVAPSRPKPSANHHPQWCHIHDRIVQVSNRAYVNCALFESLAPPNSKY